MAELENEILRQKPQNDGLSCRDGKALAFPPKIEDEMPEGQNIAPCHPEKDKKSIEQSEIRFLPCSGSLNRTPTPSLHIGEGIRKTAFTLAEVLITLGIIGVVAAMTLPALISKFQHKAFETGFKKQYAVLNNTIDFLILDQDLKECYVTVVPDPDQVTRPGNVIYSLNNQDCVALKEGMISKLKLTPLNKKFSYTKRNNVLSEGGVSVNRTVDYDNSLYAMSSYMLPDGAVLMFVDTNSSYYDAVCLVLDVNGEKGPNRWGYDVFWLMFTKYKNKIRLSDEYASLSEKGGSLPRNILMNKWSNDFSSNYYGVWGQ